MSDAHANTGRMVAVGNDRLTLPLAAIGFEPVRCTGHDALTKALQELAERAEVVLVVCGESQAERTPEALERFRQTSSAILIALPDTAEARRLDAEVLRVAIEQAAGVDLLGKELKEN